MSCCIYDGKVFHTRAGSRITCVAEAVVCAWNDTCSLRREWKLRPASAGSKLNVQS